MSDRPTGFSCEYYLLSESDEYEVDQKDLDTNQNLAPSDELTPEEVKTLGKEQDLVSTTSEIMTTSVLQGILQKDAGPIRDNPTASRALYTGVLTQIKALLGANFGFESLARFLQTVHVSEKRRNVFLDYCVGLYVSLSVLNTMITLVDPKRKNRIPPEQTEQSTMNIMAKLPLRSQRRYNLANQGYSIDEILAGIHRSDIKFAYKVARRRYIAIRNVLRKIRVPSDPTTILAWYGFGDNYFALLSCAYGAFKIVIEELKEANNWTTLQISRQDFLEYAYKIYFEEVRGDQQTSISEKNMLQIVVMGIYANVQLEELQLVFRMFSDAQKLGWLKESHQTGFEPFWEPSYGQFRRVLDYTRSPLLRNFDTGIHLTAEKNKLIFAKMDRYDAMFQIVPRECWLSGELSGKIELIPFRDFDYMPNKDKPTVNLMAGAPSSGKTTTQGAFDCISSLQGQIPSLMVLSDDTNWATFAPLPQTKVKSNTAYSFNEGVGIHPQGLPVLILDIVRSPDEIPRDETLTIYDRIVKVDSHNFFNLDFKGLLQELRAVGEQMGYEGTDRDGRLRPPGIIAVRNMRRRGNVKGKYVDIEVEDMIQLLNGFASWRRNDHTIPMRLKVEEAAQAGTNIAYGAVNTQAQNFLGSNIRDGRRHNTMYDISTQQPKDVMSTIKEFAENTFFRELVKNESSGTKSSLDSLLDLLNCNDEAEKAAVKTLYSSGKLNDLRLMFWHNKTKGQINLVQIIPPTFMPQITSMNPREEMMAVLKSNNMDPQKFFRKDRNVDIIALQGDRSILELQSSGKEEEDDESGLDWSLIAG